MNEMRRRRQNKEDYDSNQSVAKRKNMFVSKNGRPQKLGNKLLFGFTFTVGVAAVAMYAMNSHAREPQEMFSKVFQLLTYKDLI